MLFGCGGKQKVNKDTISESGFISGYNPLQSNYEEVDQKDPYFKVLEPEYLQPYWVQSLEMDDNSVVTELLDNNDRTILFSFPQEFPDYLPVSITGWAPANQSIIIASQDIFKNLTKTLNIDLVQTNDGRGLNTISISQSIQAGSAGFSYFPNNFYYIGSDVFISKNYSEPFYLTESQTNYDYEVLLHEIGHALGLKHPFEADGNNNVILNTVEDNTKYTAMSYNDHEATFDGIFRDLDWMALCKLYGVDELFRPENNTYEFNKGQGVFIIDGNGIDTINAVGLSEDVLIDLREGSHSYVGNKASFITGAGQLTISHGSHIENATTGIGDDYVVGNKLSNNISTGIGDDKIFLGDGSDVVTAGPGFDTIDLSEDSRAVDKIIVNLDTDRNSYDIVYGFSQGVGGDIVELKSIDIDALKFLPLINLDNVPSGRIDQCFLRIIGEGLDNARSIEQIFNVGDTLTNLNLTNREVALLLTAKSQSTGADQHLYFAENQGEHIRVQEILQFKGIT